MSITRRTHDHPLVVQRLDEAFEDIDQWRGRAEVAEAELREARAEVRQLNEALEQAIAGYDARVLPHLDTPEWPTTTEPVRPLIADQLADQHGFEGWA